MCVWSILSGMKFFGSRTAFNVKIFNCPTAVVEWINKRQVISSKFMNGSKQKKEVDFQALARMPTVATCPYLESEGRCKVKALERKRPGTGRRHTRYLLCLYKSVDRFLDIFYFSLPFSYLVARCCWWPPAHAAFLSFLSHPSFIRFLYHLLRSPVFFTVSLSAFEIHNYGSSATKHDHLKSYSVLARLAASGHPPYCHDSPFRSSNSI